MSKSLWDILADFYTFARLRVLNYPKNSFITLKNLCNFSPKFCINLIYGKPHWILYKGLAALLLNHLPIGWASTLLTQKSILKMEKGLVHLMSSTSIPYVLCPGVMQRAAL